MTTHLRTSEKFFCLRFLIRSFTATSEKAANIPLSILPLTAYLWHSLRTLLQSGKCLLISSARTFLSASTFSSSKIEFNLAKNCAAIVGLSFLLIEKSTTEHLLCKGSIILFL